jgi:hypothetical protein
MYLLRPTLTKLESPGKLSAECDNGQPSNRKPVHGPTALRGRARTGNYLQMES